MTRQPKLLSPCHRINKEALLALKTYKGGSLFAGQAGGPSSLCAIRAVFAYKKTGTRLAASLSCRTYVPIIPVRASRAHMRVVGEVEIVRARAVKVDPTLHDPRRAGVDRDGEVV